MVKGPNCGVQIGILKMLGCYETINDIVGILFQWKFLFQVTFCASFCLFFISILSFYLHCDPLSLMKVRIGTGLGYHTFSAFLPFSYLSIFAYSIIDALLFV